MRKVVADAWDWLYAKKKVLIIQSFRHVGIALAVDGSEDSELRIKGLEDLIIGDWHEGGLDCNLDSKGLGDLNWATAELLNASVATAAEEEFANEIDPEDEGEYVHSSDIELDMGIIHVV